jgi:hypothetical protein
LNPQPLQGAQCTCALVQAQQVPCPAAASRLSEPCR